MEETQSRTGWMPETIGNYEIIGRIGKGGMGDIYKAVQKSLDRTVALKVLSPQMGRSDEFSKRFEIEARAISMLQHQNIVSIYEFGEENGLKYFAMQFVDGVDLGQKLLQKKPLAVSEIIDYSKQICRALLYAHEKNIIHRDIKPQNILIDKCNICRLTDFGIAKIYAETNITMTGMAVGTPEYMSPEQAEGDVLDVQTDIYSLGIVIYEMLTKNPPFTGKNPVAIAYKQVHELPVPPSALRKDTPKRLELIVLKALKKNRMERYKAIKDMLGDLDTVDLDEQTGKPTISLATHKKDSKTGSSDKDRRITDRRFGGRRKSESYLARANARKQYWKKVWETQGISLVLILVMVILLIIHILGQH